MMYFKMRKYHSAPLDKYFTDPKVAKDLLEKLFQFIDIDHFDTIIESSAGNASFSKLIPQFYKDKNIQLLSFDIKPEHESIVKMDFLTFDPEKYNITDNDKDKVLVGFNPPYGKHSADARAFINKSFEFADHVAMIVPQTVLLPKYMSTLPSNVHAVLKIPIKGNPFIVDGKPYEKTLRTTFVYFQRLDHDRAPPPKPIVSNGNWEFLKKNDSEQRAIASFKIQQNGSKAGRCVLNGDEDYVIKNKKSKIYTDFYILVKPEFKNKLKEIQKKVSAYEHSFVNQTTWKSLCKSRVAECLNSIIAI